LIQCQTQAAGALLLYQNEDIQQYISSLMWGGRDF